MTLFTWNTSLMIGIQTHLVMCTALCSRTSCCRILLPSLLLAWTTSCSHYCTPWPNPRWTTSFMGKQCPGNGLLLHMLSSVSCSLHYILLSLASTTVILGMAFPVVHLSVRCLLSTLLFLLVLALLAVLAVVAILLTSVLLHLHPQTVPAVHAATRALCVAWSTGTLHHGLLLLAAHTPAVLCSPTSYTVHRGCWHTLPAATHCAVLHYVLSCYRGCCIRSPGGMRPVLLLLSSSSYCPCCPCWCTPWPVLSWCLLVYALLTAVLLWHASYVSSLLLLLVLALVSGRTCGCMGPCCTHLLCYPLC